MAGPIRAEQSFRPSYRPAPKARAQLDPEMVRLGLLVAAFAGGLAALGAGVMLLRSAPHGVPVIEADARPVRIKPANPGGMTVSGAELGNGGAAGDQQLLPVAEQPQIRQLKAQMRALQRQVEREKAAQEAALKLAQAQLAAKIVTARAAAPQVASHLAAQVADQVAAAPVVQRASATAVIERPAAPLAPAAPVPPPAAGTQVQLGAFLDEQSARQKWAELLRALPELLGGRLADVEKLTVANRTMYRLRTGAFGDVAAATGFCAKLRAQQVACEVAAF